MMFLKTDSRLRRKGHLSDLPPQRAFSRREVVSAILEGDDWKEALRNVFMEADGTMQTPIRLLIKDFPDLVQPEQEKKLLDMRC
jgi:hypothetical protein